MKLVKKFNQIPFSVGVSDLRTEDGEIVTVVERILHVP
jgi:hypothetical protein